MKRIKYIKEFKQYEEDAMFEMANFGTKTTGLPMIIWVSEKRASHAARIKVARTYDTKVQIGNTFSVLISINPKIVAGDKGDISPNDLKEVYNWVILNRELLLKYWNHELLTDELILQLSKV